MQGSANHANVFLNSTSAPAADIVKYTLWSHGKLWNINHQPAASFIAPLLPTMFSEQVSNFLSCFFSRQRLNLGVLVSPFILIPASHQ